MRDNPAVRAGLGWETFRWALTSLKMSNWHPVTWWSYQLDITLFGANPGAMHLVNVVIHGLNSLLIGALFVRFGIQWIPALLSAAIFAVHPLHVESVAWIAERKDVLSTCFFLLTLLAWDGYVRHGRPLHYVVALIFAALGLMSKAMLVTLPCLLLVLDGWPYARLRSGTQPWFRDRCLLARCVEKLPFAALAAVCAWFTIAAQAAGGAVRPLEVVSFTDRLGNAIVSYGVYVAKAVLPSSLSFMYLFAPPEAVWVAVSLLFLGLISWWAASQGRAALAGWLWFLVSLLPVIGLVTVGEHARADRYMYLPMIGLLMMLAGAVPWRRLFDRFGCSGRRAGLVAAVGAVLLLAFAAHRYAGYWRDSETLFQHALSVDPKNHVTHTLLAVTYERLGRPQPAFTHAESALRLAPRSAASANAAVSASNAALLLGNQELARSYLERAIAAAPNFPKPHYNLGILALQAGDPLAAKALFETAIALDGQYSEAYNNLGVAFLQLGQTDKAIAAFSEAVRNDPGNQKARTNLARSRGVWLP